MLSAAWLARCSLAKYPPSPVVTKGVVASTCYNNIKKGRCPKPNLLATVRLATSCRIEVSDWTSSITKISRNTCFGMSCRTNLQIGRCPAPKLVANCVSHSSERKRRAWGARLPLHRNPLSRQTFRFQVSFGQNDSQKAF